MTGQEFLNLSELREFAPSSPILAFRPMDTGSPMQDWCSHMQNNPMRRRELEEFANLGNVVVRIADGTEPKPFEKVKILSPQYAMKILMDELDAKEFIRSVKAIASPDADGYELEQIAAFYYREIRRRGASEVLKEMGLLGMEMQAVASTVNEREFEFVETVQPEQKLSVADQRRVQNAQKNQSPLPPRTPNFDAELESINKKISAKKITNFRMDEFADYYLSDADKSIEELDADFETFEKLEQYDENGVIGFSMSGGQRPVVVFDFETEIDSSYLPWEIRSLGRELNLLFVGHRIGGKAAQNARRFVLAQRIEQRELQALKNGFGAMPVTRIPPAKNFPDLPFSNEEFSEWLAAKMDHLYPNRTLRTIRRLATNKAGITFEYASQIEANPEWDEMNYAASVCRILWKQKFADFHLRSLRRTSYQNFYLDIRKAVDTAEVARLKKGAYDAFKEQKELSLKEFTALNTVGKSQEARIARRISFATRKLLSEIERASYKRVRYYKYFLYNDPEIKNLTRQEKQCLWDALKQRETVVKQKARNLQPTLFARRETQKQIVRVTPQTV